MQDPQQDRFIKIMLSVAAGAAALLLLIPLPAGQGVHPVSAPLPAHIGEAGSRERLHRAKEPPKDALTYLTDRWESMGGLPSLGGRDR